MTVLESRAHFGLLVQSSCKITETGDVIDTNYCQEAEDKFGYHFFYEYFRQLNLLCTYGKVSGTFLLSRMLLISSYFILPYTINWQFVSTSY